MLKGNTVFKLKFTIKVEEQSDTRGKVSKLFEWYLTKYCF